MQMSQKIVNSRSFGKDGKQNIPNMASCNESMKEIIYVHVIKTIWPLCKCDVIN